MEKRCCECGKKIDAEETLLGLRLFDIADELGIFGWTQPSCDADCFLTSTDVAELETIIGKRDFSCNTNDIVICVKCAVEILTTYERD